MQPVNFQCGHCGNLMAVAPEFLGQQVRCPHCQQIVLAPAPAPPTPLPPPADNDALQDTTFSLTRAIEDQESIFTEVVDDDLFGGPTRPILEVPPPAPKDLEHTIIHEAPGSSASLMVGPSAPAGDGAAYQAQAGFSGLHAPVQPEQNANGHALPAPPAPSPAPAPELPEPSVLPSMPVTRRQERESLLAAYLLIILVPYAIFMTVATIYLYFTNANQPHPLEMLPDNIGDQPGVTRKSGNRQTYQRVPVDVPLSSSLKTSLGQPLQLGDLEVLPTKVEQRPIVYVYRDNRIGGPSREEALILHLTLTNKSKDLSFHPTDAAFNRWWKEGQASGAKPYCFLEAGQGKRFYGGPFRWPSPSGGDAYIQGQESDDKPLGPGEQRQTVICTDPADQAPKYLQGQPSGKFLWRVHLRRGLVPVRGREVSATGVIGVEFTYDQIRR